MPARYAPSDAPRNRFLKENTFAPESYTTRINEAGNESGAHRGLSDFFYDTWLPQLTTVCLARNMIPDIQFIAFKMVP